MTNKDRTRTKEDTLNYHLLWTYVTNWTNWLTQKNLSWQRIRISDTFHLLSIKFLQIVRPRKIHYWIEIINFKIIILYFSLLLYLLIYFFDILILLQINWLITEYIKTKKKGSLLNLLPIIGFHINNIYFYVSIFYIFVF